MDCATELFVFVLVVLPVVRNGVLTVSAFIFILAWGRVPICDHLPERPRYLPAKRRDQPTGDTVRGAVEPADGYRSAVPRWPYVNCLSSAAPRKRPVPGSRAMIEMPSGAIVHRAPPALADRL